MSRSHRLPGRGWYCPNAHGVHVKINDMVLAGDRNELFHELAANHDWP